jgi:hypothetical protein
VRHVLLFNPGSATKKRGAPQHSCGILRLDKGHIEPQLLRGNSLYWHTMSELFVKQELVKTLPTLDAILLDIDGVVLDVAQTFRVVASEVTQWYAVNILKLQDTGTFFETAETELFKNAGGFNNDWDLANGAVAMLVAKHAQSGSTETAALREQEPSWEEYTREIKQARWRPCRSRRLHSRHLDTGATSRFRTQLERQLVTQLFQEMYAGDAQCRQLYGFAP